MSAIKVVDYDPAWPALFEAQKRTILSIIGDLVDDIHHIGSTSVEGLCAKPKIDIHAVLLSDDLIPEAIERVKPHDYSFQGDPYDCGMWTFTQGHGSYGARLYLCGPDNATHVKRMRFRDYLRAQPEAAAAYGALKRKLALQAADGDWKFYTGGKSNFVAEIVRLASLQFEQQA
jgi:GrpB-like predicted nucleotidyltransferase (UPF0157 family)